MKYILVAVVSYICLNVWIIERAEDELQAAKAQVEALRRENAWWRRVYEQVIDERPECERLDDDYVICKKARP